MSSQQLVIFTIGFPYGNSETSFLTKEIEIIANHFNSLIIIPINPDRTKSTQSLPANVTVINSTEYNSVAEVRSYLDYFFVFKIFINEFLKSANFRLFRHARYHLSELFVYLRFAKTISLLEENDTINKKNCLYYSYWFDAGASIMSVYKKRYRSDVRFVSRAHGFDLYQERNEKGYIFPRHLQVKYVNKVLAISQNGQRYLVKLFPGLKGKIECSRLGTDKPIRPEPEKLTVSSEIHLVSCSSLIPLKRVNKIVEILMHCKASVKWTHFGDGIMRNEIENLSSKLPSNISVDLKGNTDNDSILKFYSENKVSWFINVSETEGIPVSIMEAISYGIPIIAPDIGGVKEIVNKDTGVLILRDFLAGDIAKIIENPINTDGVSDAIIEFWRENYNAERNYTVFAKQLKEIIYTGTHPQNSIHIDLNRS